MSKSKSVTIVTFLIATLLLVACGDTAATNAPAPAATTAAPAATTASAVATTVAAPTAPAVATTAAAPAATTAAAVATTAAAPAATTAAAKPKPQGSKEGTLTIWADANRVKVLEPLGKKFTEKYQVPVVVQELGFGDIRDQLKIAGPAGEGPDIIIGAHDWIGELVTNGLLEPLELGDKAKNIDPVAIKGFTYNGKVYGLPYAVEAIALMYNKDLVPTPPATWDELKTIAKKLQDDKKVEQGYVLAQGDPYHTYPILSGFGGYVFGKTADGGYNAQDLGLDSAGGKAAIAEIDSMVKAGLLRKDVTGDLVNSLFKQGKAAMWITGPWSIKDVKEAKINYGVAKIPTMKEKSRPFVGVQGFMVNSFGKNKLLAQTFLSEYIATDDAQQAMYDADPRVPSWLPVRAKLSDPDFKAFAASIADGDPMPAIPAMSAVWDAWTKGLTLVFQQQGTPDKDISDAAKTIRDKIATSK